MIIDNWVFCLNVSLVSHGNFAANKGKEAIRKFQSHKFNYHSFKHKIRRYKKWKNQD